MSHPPASSTAFPVREEPLTLLDAVPVLISYVDREGRYRFVNRAYTDWFGRPEVTIVGQMYTDVFPEDAAAEIAPHVTRALAGETVTWDRWVKSPRGELRFLQATYVPQWDDKNQVQGIVATIIDITERRRAEEKSERRTKTLRLLYEAAAGVLGSHEPQRLLDSLFDRLSEHLGLELYFHYRLVPGERCLRLAAFRGVDPAFADSIQSLEFGQAVCGHVAETGEPVIVDNVDQTNTAMTGLIRRMGVTAYACFPLQADGKLLGTLSFGTRRAPTFGAEDLDLIRAVCDQLAVAIDRQETTEALRESEGRLRFLDDLGAATRDLTEPGEVMATLTRLLGEHLHASRCAYADVNRDANRFVIRHDYTRGYPSNVGTYDLELFGSRAASDQRAGRTLVIRDVDRELAEEDGAVMFNAIGIKAIICCPLIKGGRLAAMMAVSQDTPRDWTAGEISLVKDVVDRSWAFIERARADREQRLARDAAEAASRAKDQFLAVLSHELRTPLTPVVMTMSALENDAELPARLRDDVSMIRRNIALESKLIDDLLDLSRVTSGKLRLNIHPTDLHDLARHVVESCRSDAQEKNLRLTLDLAATHSWVRGDPARLQQVLWNLLRNAIKFTPAGRGITVRTSDAAGGEQVRLQVIDEGVGIAPKVLPKIFDAFEQGDPQVGRSFGGLGLGLAIAKMVAELHGGRLWAESPGPGQGATFTLELHTGTPDRRPRAGENGMPAASAAGVRILLVEDHPDTARTMRRLLSASGFNVTTAGSVADGLRLATQEQFDLLVSDIGLPDGTGYDLMEQIRATRRLPGIALSGYGMEDDIRRSLDAGFAMHLTKPVDIQLLEQAISTLHSLS
jgi:PAS domain S-box-containing protein